ncbi:MAG: methyltransferase domain-containing protein [Pyrinomonadaceae bacterium]
MLASFNTRCHDSERLDRGEYTAAEYERWQREMRYINRFLGDTRCLRLALASEIQDVGSAVSILDIGAGSGEMLEVSKTMIGGRSAFLVGAEMNAEAAQSINARVGIWAVRCDARLLPFAGDSFDFVVGSLLAHHLDDEAAIELIAEMSRVARRRFFVIDLHRHAAAFYLYRTFGPLVLQKFTVDDGALSIRRSFRPLELKQLAEKAGVPDATVTRRAAFRIVLSGSKAGAKA